MNPDKEIAIHEYIQSQIEIPFEYGVHDCPLFAMGVLDILAETNYREEMSGKWHDQKSAWRYARKEQDIIEFFETAGCTEVEWAKMQTGDFVCMEQKLAHEKKWRSVAVCIGSKVATLTRDENLIILPISAVPNMVKVLRYV